ncbi:hypothetical protein [Thiorhodovibrio frisius]|uniref:hypothetical protein n=1 Tax=Thiorhodovibrio frisius TaxID=631362 RepID=UPI00167F23AD|nr:hypothetical protein [Thiorhodovibrio frisius]
MHAGRIYLGAGNSSNRGPAANAGRVPIIAYDPALATFVTEGEVAEEQIDLYRVLDGQLYIPGHDATQNWDWGNFYRRGDKGEWKKYRTIPGALHVYDIVLHGKRLHAALGIRGAAAVASSENGGSDWSIQALGRGRVYALLSIGGELFAIKTFRQTRIPRPGIARLMPGNGFQPVFGYTKERVFPRTDFTDNQARMTRLTPVGDDVLYLGADVHNDHQIQPFGLYLAILREGQLDFVRIGLPEELTPRDLLLRGDQVYLLASATKGSVTRNQVLAVEIDQLSKEKRPKILGLLTSLYSPTEDAGHPWRRILVFDYPTFARSFEEMNGDFYFGMGMEIVDENNWRRDELQAETGRILRVQPGK